MAGISAVSVIDTFRAVMSRQFELFYEELNIAIAVAGGEPCFGPGDEGKVASYFYVLLALVGEWSKHNNPFQVSGRADSDSAPIQTMGALCASLSRKYKRNTTQRYVRELERMRLVTRAGRGDNAVVSITMPAVRALARSIQCWVAQSLEIDAQLLSLNGGTTGRSRCA